MQESRAHPRAPIELRVTYERLNAFFADYTRDISMGGIFVKTDNPLAVGSELQFQITLPRRPQALQLRGRVAWIHDGREEAKPGASHRGMGIQFLWSDDAAKASFERLVEVLIVETLGPALYAKLQEKGRI